MHTSILIVGIFLSQYGHSRGICEDLALRLIKTGWQVTTTSSKPGRFSRLIDMIYTAWHERDRYTVAQLDVFSGPAFLWAESMCWVLQRLQKPYVLTLHGGNLPNFAQRWPGRVRCLLGSAAVVTTPSHYLREQMQPYGNTLFLLPNPVEISIYPFHPRSRPQPRLMWLRAFHQTYNPQLAIKVLSSLSGNFPDTQLTMVGPDKRDGSMQQAQILAAEMGLVGSVKMPGGVPKPEVPQWLDQSDIFLNTTNVDNTPVSVIEAMACGLCVVSTNVGGIPYLLTHDHDALLVPPDDPEAMAAAVRRILTEPGLAEHLSRNARVTAEKHDWSNILPQWQKLLSNVMKTPNRL